MERTLHRTLAIAAILGLAAGAAHAQRYLSEVFTDAQITVTPNVPYGQNIDFLTSDFSNLALVVPEITELQTDVATNTPIPAPYFDPTDASTVVKVADLRMDIYQPDQGVDAVTARPVVIYIHTGNALPPPVNGSPCGTRTDSAAVETCRRMAKRGYVAASIDYRLGWNPISSDPNVRRGTLLNAIYRAIHDVKQCVRTMKQDAVGGPNAFHIDPDRVILLGEGTGGYISLATATLNHPAELFIEKFRPDPFDPTVSYVDTTRDGNIEGFGGQLNLYHPNGADSHINFCVNMGGALADSTWLEPGDAPMVAFHTIFDPFAPFTEGIVIVPTTGEQVVEVVGSNHFMEQVNIYGNNNSFADLVSDAVTATARARYGSTFVHTGSTVQVNSTVEGLYPVVTNDWPNLVPGTFEEASPWQWWDSNSAIAQTIVAAPNITADMASKASNPNMSAAKGRAMLDTVMDYMNPRIVCALQLGPCALVGINEKDPIAVGVGVYPNPSHDNIVITSAKETIRMFELYDADGRRVRAENVERTSFTLERNGLLPGAYFVQLQFDQGTVTRKLMLD